MNKINIRGVNFNNVNMSEAVAFLTDALREKKQAAVFTPNSEIVQLCIDKPEYTPLINSADLIIPDGIGVIKAARILKTPLKEKVAGYDLGQQMLAVAAKAGHKVFFLGGKPGVAEEAAEKMQEKYPGLCICGTNDGYFKKDTDGEDNQNILAKVRESGADILFVCLGVPVQEQWIADNRGSLQDVTVLLALGGSLDGYAGRVKRAPKIFIKLGLEWFYRLLREPSRIGRMMKLPKFYFGTWLYKFSRKNK